MLGSMDIHSIKKWIDCIAARDEAIAHVIKRVKPLLLARASMTNALISSGITPLQTDLKLAAKGKPLMIERSMDCYHDAFQRAAQTVLPAMTEAFPARSEEFNRILCHINEQNLNPDTVLLMEIVLAGDNSTLKLQAEKVNTCPDLLCLSVEQCLRPILYVTGYEACKDLTLSSWGRPYCPVCGAYPDLAILRRGSEEGEFLVSQGGQRWLHCPRCSNQWRFKRHACPNCNNEKNKSLEYYQVDSNHGERVYVCHECRRYLVSIDVRDYEEEPDPDVAVLGLIPLDMLMQGKGILPLSFTFWNRF